MELEKLLERCRPQLGRVLFHFRIPPEDAEDLLQETFLILISKWDSVRTPEAWLAATLRNRCIIYWRRRRARIYEAMDDAMLDLLAESQPPPQERSDLRSDLAEALARLEPNQRSILKLRFGWGCTSQEAGERIGHGAASVRKMTQRSIARLNADLAAHGFAELPVA
ncbi:MAG TPA: sigma-70 family RNA polymerase sigma factor [Thermoanaerobaculia bacterium]|nr:sigma-70 family RNA polymerase sigma factor [Thermoanaerobaculia bacterium]